jgi:tetratricopeptide (TPR) repeat protein
VRGKLFARNKREIPATDEIPARIDTPLNVLRALVSRPSSASAEAVGSACASVSAWAYDAGYIDTAISFAHVTARVLPDNPEAAFAVGRATRDAGRYPHSDAWFHRALGLARRARNAEMKARVYIGWGVLDELRGDPAAAKRKFQKALTTATEVPLPSIAAHAHQFLIPLTSATFEETFGHAVAAARLYTDDDPDLPRLASDTGALFSEHGYFGLALLLYEAALPKFSRAPDLLACYANVGRAAAALGQKRRFSEAWTEVERLSRGPLAQYHADSLLELATGAVTLRYWKPAAKMVGEARSVAERLGSAPALDRIRRLLEAIDERTGGDVSRDPEPRLEEFAFRLRDRLSSD